MKFKNDMDLFKRAASYVHPYLYICVIGLGVLLFTHCQRSLDVDILTGETRLLVEGEFTNDTAIHHISLHRSTGVTTGVQEGVSGANVYITDGVDTFRYVETSEKGRYQTPEKCAGKGGQTYRLSITDIDPDEDGKTDTYTATGLMPVPVRFDSLHLKVGVNGDGDWGDYAYYTARYNGPDYVYHESLVNRRFMYPISRRLGSDELTKFANEDKVAKVEHPDSAISGMLNCFEGYSDMKDSDTITFYAENFTHTQYEFLKELDKHVSGGNIVLEYFIDLLKIPINLPTNIEPSDKAAGYFFIYSLSSIEKIYRE